MRRTISRRAMMLGAGAGLALAARRGGAAGRGPVTGLPLPRYVSLKAGRANARRGPGLNHRVDWVFVRRGMPLQVIAEHEHWRRVRDMDGAVGWVHYSLLRGDRTAAVTVPRAALRARPAPDAPVVAWLEERVIVALDSCRERWCKARVEGRSGWIAKPELWGVDPDETFD